MSTKDMALWISEALNKKIYFEYITGLCIRILRHIHPTVKKAFGSLIYQNTEDFHFSYAVVNNEKSIDQSIK